MNNHSSTRDVFFLGKIKILVLEHLLFIDQNKRFFKSYFFFLKSHLMVTGLLLTFMTSDPDLPALSTLGGTGLCL